MVVVHCYKCNNDQYTKLWIGVSKHRTGGEMNMSMLNMNIGCFCTHERDIFVSKVINITDGITISSSYGQTHY